MSKCHHLEIMARHIRTSLEKGFILDSTAIHFLTSTYSLSESTDLPRLLDERFENERETVFELVISPDRSFLCDMEPFLMGHDLTLHDEHELIRLISDHKLKTHISFPDGLEYIECDMDADRVERFVRKLRITFSFPDHVFGAMTDCLSDALKHRTGTLIRHSGLTWHDSLMDFLSLFFRYGPSDPDQMLSDLEYALGIVTGSNANKSIRDCFIDSLGDHQKRLGDIETIDDMLKKNTMETLMLQGVRVPSISADTIHHKIATARRILSMVYGWTETPGPMPSSVDLGDCVGHDGIKKIVSLLS